MAGSKIRSTGQKQKKKEKKKDVGHTKKGRGGPLLVLKENVLVILGQNSPLQSGVAGEILTHFQSFIGTV